MKGIAPVSYYATPADLESGQAGEKTGDPTAAAGCIVSCAKDMAKWLQFNLDRGRVGDKQLVREDLMDLIASMHIPTGDDPSTPEQCGDSYGLGWSIFYYRGHKTLEHGGNLPGFTSSVALVPDLGLGIFISANMNVTLLPEAIFHDLIDADLGIEDGNWYERKYKANEALFEHVLSFYRSFGGENIPGTQPSHGLQEYAGVYEAAGYRRFAIEYADGELTADFNAWKVGLKHHHYDTFATTGSIGELPAGMSVTFGADPGGKIKTLSITLGGERNLGPIVFTKA